MHVRQSSRGYCLLRRRGLRPVSQEDEGDVGSIAQAVRHVDHMDRLLLGRHSSEVEDDRHIRPDSLLLPEGAPGVVARIEGGGGVDTVWDHHDPIDILAVLAGLQGAE